MRYRAAIALTVAGAAIGAFAAVPTGARPAMAESAVGGTWHVDPGSAATAPGSNYTAGGTGRLTIAPGRTIALGYPPAVRLQTPASQFRATVQADLPPGASYQIDLRGAVGTGWSQWQRLPTTLDAPADSVQLRVRLFAGQGGKAPVIRDIEVTGEATGTQQSPAVPAVSSLVYATREGLVGGITANGHVITARDHFASLPSWKSLSPKGTGDYSVRACTSSRCVYEPVWDVGPWNTKDDYWNATREQWTGLAVGRPEAEAAYQNNYNGGKDQFGRVVTNPAGIDLADGAIWDGLAMTDSGWLTVSYLWTGAGTKARVGTGGGPLNVRNAPRATAAKVGLAGGYTRLPIECQTVGQNVAGYVRTSNLWDRIGPNNFVSYAYVRLDAGVTVPNC